MHAKWSAFIPLIVAGTGPVVAATGSSTTVTIVATPTAAVVVAASVSTTMHSDDSWHSDGRTTPRSSRLFVVRGAKDLQKTAMAVPEQRTHLLSRIENEVFATVHEEEKPCRAPWGEQAVANQPTACWRLATDGVP